MEFPGVGTIPSQAPPESLRPFFQRKYKAWFRQFSKDTPGIVYRSNFMKDIEKTVSKAPRDKQAELRRELIYHWDHVILYGKESITEEEAISEWLNNRVFTTPERRKHNMEITKKITKLFFEGIDVNGRGKVSMADWMKLQKITPDSVKKEVSAAIDVNKDGFIYLEEWRYAILFFHYSSGPESPLSLMFGPIPDN